MIPYTLRPFVLFEFERGRMGLADAYRRVMPKAGSVGDPPGNDEDGRLIGDCCTE